MLTVYDVHVELDTNAKLAEMLKLKDHFKALSINSVGLDQTDFRPRTDELWFSIYGDIGPFMMKKMALECTRNVFPGALIGVSERA